jgi:hypothetical protein
VLLPPADASETNLAWITQLVAAINAWRKATNPDESIPDARYDFLVQVFAGSTDGGAALKLPLLRLDDLYLGAKLAFP